MRRVVAIWTFGVLALLLHGCGGNGGAGGGLEIVGVGRALVIRISDAATKQTVPGVEVVILTSRGTVPMLRVVERQPTSPDREISLAVARALKGDLRVGDFVLRNQLSDSDFFRGIYVRVPAGYTAIVRHILPDGAQRVKQMPRTLQDHPGCLLASERAGRVDEVFGKVGVVDLGVVELFPNSPSVVPPPVDENCP
ncbi:MAG: hypothetical protein NZ550_06230 [Fimbriimonadales bacterium]|nr:hypothetical protein [Fimbriimonadales bacterium]MDW8052169.1 hypothetical protein [Armatimonadota bacterium]